jgi:hypothetical protein
MIDGATRDTCLGLEEAMKAFAANGMWLEAWTVGHHDFASV